MHYTIWIGIISILAAYTVCVLPTAVDTIVWLSVTFSVLVAVVAYVNAGLFFWEITQHPSKYRNNGYLLLFSATVVTFSLLHGLTVIMYSILITRSTVDYVGIIPAVVLGDSEIMYNLFWTYCLSNTLGFFFAVGQVNAISISALSTFHTMLSMVTGVASMSTIVVIAVTKLVEMKPKQIKSRI